MVEQKRREKITFIGVTFLYLTGTKLYKSKVYLDKLRCTL